MPGLHDFTATTIDGEDRKLSEYSGKVVLVVNLASKCGLTPQYEGLQRLYDRFHDQGLEILGFPCNQFAGQEPGSDAEVLDFCTTNFGVTFPMFSKIEVNGDARHALYAWLAEAELEPEGKGDVKWNFGKFLVGRDGNAIGRFAPPTEPEAQELMAAIQSALAH